MYKKSLFFGAAALALLVLVAFVGCSSPTSGDTEYVTQASSGYPYPPETVFVDTRAALDGLLNDYDAETNGVWHIAFSGASAAVGDLIIPTGKTVYFHGDYSGTIAGNITVREGAKLVLVTPFTAGDTGLLLVRGTVEVFTSLKVKNNALDVADYTVENDINPGRNTVIGEKVTVLPGATLILDDTDIIPPDEYSKNKFTPAQAWAAAGQGNLTIDGALSAYDYEVKDLLVGVSPSANRIYTVASARIGPETLPARIPLGAHIATAATPEKCDGNILTVDGWLSTNGTLKDITEIKVGNGGKLLSTQSNGDILDKLTKLTIGPGASFTATTTNVTLQSLETLFLGDGSRITVPGNSVTFTQAEGKKLLTTLGKKVFYSVGTAADAIVDVVITEDASLIALSNLVVNSGSTFTLAADKTLTVEADATVDFSALTPPATATDPSPVIIDGTIAIEAGGKLIGPALSGFEATPEALFETIKLVDNGKVVLDWGAEYDMGKGTFPNKKPYIGPYVGSYDLATSPTYQWVDSSSDGAQIEINAAGLIIRDTNTGSAKVWVGNTRAVILKDQSLTLDTNVTLEIVGENTLWFVGGSDTEKTGAILKGAGKLVVQETEIVGGPYGWQVYGDSLGIYSDSSPREVVLRSSSASASVTTPAATFNALGTGLGASITQTGGSANNLVIAANTTIALGGSSIKKVGEIILGGATSNPGKITFTNETSKITTGNNTTTTTTAGSLAINGTTQVDNNVIDTIGIANLVGNKTPGTPLNASDPATKVTTTATVNTTDNDLIAEGKLASLSGRDTTYGGTVEGGSSATTSGYINSETITNADTTHTP